MPRASAYQKALALLARREHSVRELTFKLLHKDYPQHEVDEALLKLQQANYLNESRFIGCIIRARISQGAGPLKILNELQSHDIAQNLIESHEEWQEIDWPKLALHVKIKRFGPDVAIEAKQKAKQIQFLQRRGFQIDHINHAISCQDELSFFA